MKQGDLQAPPTCEEDPGRLGVKRQAYTTTCTVTDAVHAETGAYRQSQLHPPPTFESQHIQFLLQLLTGWQLLCVRCVTPRLHGTPLATTAMCCTFQRHSSKDTHPKP